MDGQKTKNKPEWRLVIQKDFFVNASREKLWVLISNPALYPGIFPHIKSIVAVDNGISHGSLGKRYLETAKGLTGKNLKINVWVEECDPGQRIIFQTDHPRVPSRFEFSIRETGRLTWQWKLWLRNDSYFFIHSLLLKLIFWMRFRTAKRNLAQYFTSDS